MTRISAKLSKPVRTSMHWAWKSPVWCIPWSESRGPLTPLFQNPSLTVIPLSELSGHAITKENKWNIKKLKERTKKPTLKWGSTKDRWPEKAKSLPKSSSMGRAEEREEGGARCRWLEQGTIEGCSRERSSWKTKRKRRHPFYNGRRRFQKPRSLRANRHVPCASPLLVLYDH